MPRRSDELRDRRAGHRPTLQQPRGPRGRGRSGARLGRGRADARGDLGSSSRDAGGGAAGRVAGAVGLAPACLDRRHGSCGELRLRTGAPSAEPAGHHARLWRVRRPAGGSCGALGRRLVSRDRPLWLSAAVRRDDGLAHGLLPAVSTRRAPAFEPELGPRDRGGPAVRGGFDGGALRLAPSDGRRSRAPGLGRGWRVGALGRAAHGFRPDGLLLLRGVQRVAVLRSVRGRVLVRAARAVGQGRRLGRFGRRHQEHWDCVDGSARADLPVRAAGRPPS